MYWCGDALMGNLQRIDLSDNLLGCDSQQGNAGTCFFGLGVGFPQLISLDFSHNDINAEIPGLAHLPYEDGVQDMYVSLISLNLNNNSLHGMPRHHLTRAKNSLLQ